MRSFQSPHETINSPSGETSRFTSSTTLWLSQQFTTAPSMFQIRIHPSVEAVAIRWPSGKNKARHGTARSTNTAERRPLAVSQTIISGSNRATVTNRDPSGEKCKSEIFSRWFNPAFRRSRQKYPLNFSGGVHGCGPLDRRDCWDRVAAWQLSSSRERVDKKSYDGPF